MSLLNIKSPHTEHARVPFLTISIYKEGWLVHRFDLWSLGYDISRTEMEAKNGQFRREDYLFSAKNNHLYLLKMHTYAEHIRCTKTIKRQSKFWSPTSGDIILNC